MRCTFCVCEPYGRLCACFSHGEMLGRLRASIDSVLLGVLGRTGVVALLVLRKMSACFNCQTQG